MSHRAISAYTAKLDWKRLFRNLLLALATMSVIYFPVHAVHFSDNIQIESLIIIGIAIFGSLIIFALMNRDLLIEAK